MEQTVEGQLESMEKKKERLQVDIDELRKQMETKAGKEAVIDG